MWTIYEMDKTALFSECFKHMETEDGPIALYRAYGAYHYGILSLEWFSNEA